MRIDNIDLGFSFVVEPKEHSMDFFVYAIEAVESSGKVLFHKKGCGHYPEPVETTEEADVFIHGYVKWDGCSNWYFDEQDRSMIHGCRKEDIVNLGLILGECWDYAKQNLPTFMKD